MTERSPAARQRLHRSVVLSSCDEADHLKAAITGLRSVVVARFLTMGVLLVVVSVQLVSMDLPAGLFAPQPRRLRRGVPE